MERHNIRRAATTRGAGSDGADHAWDDGDRRRYRPSRRPVAFDRPPEEQTWPTPLLVRTSPPRMTPNDAHPHWPGRKRPAVPVYQRRLDRHTDSIVRSFRSLGTGRTMAGRRRGLTTHRRPLAVVGGMRPLGRGTDEHEETVFAGSSVMYWRLRVGGPRMSEKRMSEMVSAWRAGLRGSVVMSPRHAVIAMVAVVVLLMGAMGTSLAQQRYVVQDGDSIESIADTFGVDPEGIRRSSYLPTGENLQAGQVLVIPDPGQSPADAALMAAELEGTSPWVSDAHWVTSGDTLAGIAAAYGHDPAALAEFNGLADPTEITIGQRILIPPTRDASEAMTSSDANAVFVPTVGTHQQSRNLSCEYAATFIATAAFGGGVDEETFIESVPSALNPHYGYRGNIDGWWGNTDDYGVYPEPLAPVLNAHGFMGEVMYTEGDTSQLVAHIDAGHPVVVWLGLWGDTRERLDDDGAYSVAAGMHVVTVFGYDDDGVYVSDPANASYDFYGWDEFTGMWKVLDGMSMAVYPS